MKHIEVSEDFIDNIYNDNVLLDDELENGFYYHFYSYTDKQENYKWGGFVKSSFFYPFGGIAYKFENKFYLVDREKKVLGQKGLNPFQWITIDALTRDSIELVILTGVAGSGKTFLSLAYALEEVYGDSKYNKIILSRPRQELQRSQGFLPGTEKEKIQPFMMPFFDNARSLGYIQKFKKGLKMGEDVRGIIFQPLETIKGRNFQNSIVIVDEASDMRYREIESFLTRLDNSKVILSGDIKQIDDKTFDRNKSPLEYTARKFDDVDFAVEICNPVSSRKGKITEFVINNFDKKEFSEGEW